MSMSMSKEQYDEIRKQYCFTESEAEDAFAFVWDVLRAEARATKEKDPYAIRTIYDLTVAADVVLDAQRDTGNENFDEN